MERKTILIIAGVLIIVAIITILLLFKLRVPEYQAYFEEKYLGCISDHALDYNVVMAEKTGDEKYCKKLSGVTKEYCLVVARKDSSGCELINISEDDKKTCVAVITKDRSLCNPMNYDCLAKATGDISYCNNLTEEDRGYCIAHATLDADYFLNEEVKTECADTAYLFTMYAYRDKNICKKIISPEIREQCLAVSS